MNQQRPDGRRRAQDEAEVPSAEPASFVDLATMWRSFSDAYGEIEHHRRYFVNTAVDDRLAEQLSLVGMLHDWQPVTQGEVRELVYLLELYVEPHGDASRDEVGRAVNTVIRQMAARRGSGGSGRVG